jgi:hypothetical protein
MYAVIVATGPRGLTSCVCHIVKHKCTATSNAQGLSAKSRHRLPTPCPPKLQGAKQRDRLSYPKAPPQLWGTHSCGNRAQIGELEHIITVRRPHRQHASSAADTSQAEVEEHK